MKPYEEKFKVEWHGKHSTPGSKNFDDLEEALEELKCGLEFGLVMTIRVTARDGRIHKYDKAPMRFPI